MAAIVLLAAGCAPAQSGLLETDVPSEISTVIAEERDISSVVTARGIAIANPTFVVTAPRSGTWSTSMELGQRLRRGTPIGRIGGVTIRSEASGLIVSLPVGAYAQVGAGIPVVEVQAEGFGIQAEFELDVAYRLYGDFREGRAVIANGVGSVNCTPVIPLSVSAETPSEDNSRLTVLCLLPRNTSSVFAGLPATVGFATGTARNVVAIPIESVSGSAESGAVSLVTSDGVEVVSVTLGITDGSWIEITSGLSIGDTIQGIAPSITEGM
jgi:multidrug efflux pump subunit AcrA (membrane-fusion protein)